ncbi:GNAT family N-acetyltransferase [Arthrobacter sp. TMN-37]
MGTQGSNDLLSTWITGWAACRGYDRQDDGRTTSVVLTDKDGRDEHFLYEPSEELLLQVAAETKADPNRVLTVATNRMEELIAVTQPLELRVVDRAQCLMSAEMADQDVEDPKAPDGYVLVRRDEPGCRRVEVTFEGRPAARGAVSVVGDFAVYDGIATEQEFRRRGLASFVMRALTAAVLEDDVRIGLLMATADGRELYQFLGWQQLADVFVLRG